MIAWLYPDEAPAIKPRRFLASRELCRERSIGRGQGKHPSGQSVTRLALQGYIKGRPSKREKRKEDRFVSGVLFVNTNP